MDELRKFYNGFPVVEYKKGETIYAQNTVPTHAYAIKTGVVRMYTITPSGEERTNSFAVKDELSPVCWLFDKTPTTMFHYIAHTDCQVYEIDKGVFSKAVTNNQRLTKAILDHFMNDYIKKAMQIRALEQPRALTKLLLTIDYLCQRHGSRLFTDTIRIKIPLTQQDLASLTGLTRETVATEIAHLKREEVLVCQNKTYTVNTPKLSKYLNYDYNPEMKIQT